MDYMMVFNNKNYLHVSANSGHLQVITILLKDCHIRGLLEKYPTFFFYSNT